MTTYAVSDGPKLLQETLSVAQQLILAHGDGRCLEHSARLQRLINECERLRPTGPDGKHGSRHTPWCGCEE